MAKAGRDASIEIATGARLDEILTETGSIWSEGLPLERYRQWQLDQAATPWARESLSRLMLIDDGVWQSSAKRYRFTAWTGHASVKVVGIGAVFTPAARRGVGHARVLIDHLLAEARQDGAQMALLFSEIGSAYYESMGFHVVPTTAITLDVPRGVTTTAGIRAGTPADLAAVAELGRADGARADFALDRSASLIEFGMIRRRRLVELGAPAMRSFDWLVAERGGRLTASLVTSTAASGIVVECAADEDRDGRDLLALLSTAAEGGARVRACWPAWLRPRGLGVMAETPVHEIMMVRALADPASDLRVPLRPLSWPLDVF